MTVPIRQRYAVRSNSPRVSIRRATEADGAAISTLIRRNADAVLSADYTQKQLNAWKRYNTAARIRWRLGELAKLLKGHPDLPILIEGHTDSVGAPASNQMLSENRANAV